MLTDGFHPVPTGKIAAVVTYLELLTKPDWVAQKHDKFDLELKQERQMALSDYRELFKAVGEKWLWTSRLQLSDEALANIIHSPERDLFAVTVQGDVAGLVELMCADPENIELSFFGLKPDFTGRGLGQKVMARVLDQAWQGPTKRMWLNTCSFDHPAALAFYQKCGFRPTKFAVEISDDPRITGALPKGAAPHIPLLNNGLTTPN